ncbi:uncharacterized protein [Littorina saxatilis]|uniref:uncharacterized protein n=1 Tax=Littorina saxatilis TaxID=31220 RepID=UPI0038B59F49
MSHIDNSAYLREKEEADEVYQRLLKQTSGAFTSAVAAQSTPTKPVVALSQPSGDVTGTKPLASPSATPREGDITPTSQHIDSPSDLPSGRRGPTPTFDSDKVLNCPQDDQSPHPVPTPRQNAGPSRDEGDAPDLHPERRVPSRASDGNYSMDSFEQSYISERGEVVVLGDDADLLDSPDSRPIQFDSDDEGF